MNKMLGVLLLTTCAARAGLLVLPNSNADTEGNGLTVAVLGEGTTEETFQWDVSSSQFSSVPTGSPITAIGFRLNAGADTGPLSPLTVGTFDLQLSAALNPIGALSTTEANNIGPDAVTVLSGSLIIPANAFTGGSAPNPFYLINFTTPYIYKGGNLLFSLDVVNSGLIGVDANSIDSTVDTVGAFNGGAARAEFYDYPITEIQFGGAAATPEPSSLLMVGTGLIFLAGCGLRVAKR